MNKHKNVLLVALLLVVVLYSLRIMTLVMTGEIGAYETWRVVFSVVGTIMLCSIGLFFAYKLHLKMKS